MLPSVVKQALIWAWEVIRGEVERLPIHKKEKDRIGWHVMEDRLRSFRAELNQDPRFREQRSTFWRNSKVTNDELRQTQR